MINESTLTVSSFVSQAQLLVPIMHFYLSGDSNRKIAINIALSSQKSLIIPIEEADADCIMVEDFLAMLDIRMNAELAYRNEIMQLKDSLCEEFNKLCNEVTDETFIKFVRDQRQKIINAVIDETKIEQKMIAEQFYNDVMNGWDEKALNLEQFGKTVFAILWKPLLTTLPKGALDMLRELIKLLMNDKSTTKLEEMTTQFLNYMKEKLRAKEVKDSDYDSGEGLRLALEQLSKERQICNIEVTTKLKRENIVVEFANKCIEEVTFITHIDEFLENEPKIKYDRLKISGKTDAMNVKRIVGKIQRRIVELDWNLQDNNIGDEGAQTVSLVLKELKDILDLNLNIEFNKIGPEGAEAVSLALKELKCISTLDLNIWNNTIGGKGTKAISAALKELHNISTLSLNFQENNIGDEGANAISNALKDMNNISILNLNVWENNIEKEGACAISFALKRLKNISTLNLLLGCNEIGADGAKAISIALKELNNISTLDLSLWGGLIREEGAKALSATLVELKNISTLNLNLCNNNVGEEGAKAISIALKELKNVSILNLNLRYNNIEKESIAAFEQLKLLHRDYKITWQI